MSHRWLITHVFWKASAKVHLFRELAKCFRVFFKKEADFSRLFDKGQDKRALERGNPCGKTAGHSIRGGGSSEGRGGAQRVDGERQWTRRDGMEGSRGTRRESGSAGRRAYIYSNNVRAKGRTLV